MSTTLISAQANATTSDAVELWAQDDAHFKRAMQIDGNWGGATATLSVSVDNVTFCNVDHIGNNIFVATADAYAVIDTVGRTWVKLTTAGGDGTTSINLKSN